MSAWPLLLALAFPVLAGDPPPAWAPPDKDELILHQRMLGRMKLVAPGEPVDDALRSLEEPVRLDLGCKLVITVRTELKHWQPIGEKTAWYEWGGVSAAEGEKNGVHTVDFVNVLSYDAQSIAADDVRGLTRKAAVTALLYHELLHGQLLIKAMKGDAKWRKAFCAGADLDDGPADLKDPHKVIPALEEAYRESLWEKVKDRKIEKGDPWESYELEKKDKEEK